MSRQPKGLAKAAYRLAASVERFSQAEDGGADEYEDMMRAYRRLRELSPAKVAEARKALDSEQEETEE